MNVQNTSVIRCQYCRWPDTESCCVKGMENKFNGVKSAFLIYISASESMHQSPFDLITIRKYSEAKKNAFKALGVDYE